MPAWRAEEALAACGVWPAGGVAVGIWAAQRCRTLRAEAREPVVGLRVERRTQVVIV